MAIHINGHLSWYTFFGSLALKGWLCPRCSPWTEPPPIARPLHSVWSIALGVFVARQRFASSVPPIQPPQLIDF
jgi:hypothetical protein